MYLSIKIFYELIVDQLVGFSVVEPTYQGSNLGTHTFFWDFIGIYRRYALSDRGRHRRRRSACDDFMNLKICWPSPSKVLIEVVFYVRVFIGVSVHTY